MGLLPALAATDRWALAATLAQAALLLLGARLALSLYHGYRTRMRFRALRAQGIVRRHAATHRRHCPFRVRCRR